MRTSNFERTSCWPARAFAILLVLLAVSGVAELLARTILFPEWKALSPDVVGDNPYFGVFAARPDLSVRRLSPGNYDVVNSTNSFGFRDREKGFAEDLSGVWLAGDSNTFGMGIDDDKLFSTRLDRMGFRVANVANEGGNMASQLTVMRRLAALGHRPRAVIYLMSLNDSIRVYDPAPLAAAHVAVPTTPGARAMLEEGLVRLMRAEMFTALGIKTMFLRNTALYGWLKLNAVRIPAVQARLMASGAVQDIDLLPRGSVELMLVEPNAADELLASTADFAAGLRDIVRSELGARLVMVFLPSHHSLEPWRFERFASHFGLDATRYDVARPMRELGGAMTRRGVAWHDATADLKAAGASDLIFPNDVHFNARGHAVLAEALGRLLSRELGETPAP